MDNLLTVLLFCQSNYKEIILMSFIFTLQKTKLLINKGLM